MADLADVEDALVSSISTNFYPNGGGALSTVGSPIAVSRGAPTNAALTRDRKAGMVAIGVYAVSEPSRNTTRWGVQFTTQPKDTSLTATVQGISATFAGFAQDGDVAGLEIDGGCFVYAAQEADSAPLVAAALADCVRAVRVCILNGSTIVIPGAHALVARIGSTLPVVEEWSRQEQGFQISILAPSADLRDRVAGSICGSLSVVSFLSLADGSSGRIRFRSNRNIDDDQAAGVYKRDIIYDIEFATTIVTSAQTMLFADSVYNGVATMD